MTSSDVDKNRVRDIFAEIAASRREVRDASLVAPQPKPVTHVALRLTNADPSVTFDTALFQPQRKMETKEQLYEELARQRALYEPFLTDLSPSLQQTRCAVPVVEFDWRLRTDDDLSDFIGVLKGEGSWERVTIPHYGGPLGKATAFYRAEFIVTEAMLAQGAIFVHFDGVDYKAHVFVNGSLMGSHEGFFSPFEFDCTAVVRVGSNVLTVVVENDAIHMSNDSWGDDGHLYEGEKIYAATGPGYDEPVVGWHHCPPGMGIYQAVRVEARAAVHISDIFVRTMSTDGKMEAWVEVWNCHKTRCDAVLSLMVHGRNFICEATDGIQVRQSGLGPGSNMMRIPLEVPEPRLWDLESPWVYQLQARLLDDEGCVFDTASRQFGIRTFTMEEKTEPKGRFYLNGREVRLRGANTMGFEQRDVMKGDWEQLVDDILLAKICNMNFWRLTQRPVQSDVYDYCDRLGLMTQTDLPLFGCLRRTQFVEAERQAEEMERLVRSHPCNIVVSYINEPSGGALGKPHRHLLRAEMEGFFVAADEAIHLVNPDRVIKAIDGDYDPPGPGFPDNHCYCGWYNGHGVDLGRLNKGYWQAVKPGWHYGCGEFGAEGLDPVETMRKHYPASWLPQNPCEEASWTPDHIPQAQTGRFHYLWFETQHSLEGWVDESQRHQALMTRMMSEAFRRDGRMASVAIHLFIDAFPSGWMKAIMDVDRNPKPAYFAYKEAMTPLMVNLRSDRTSYWAGEELDVEAWVCNDLGHAIRDVRLVCTMEVDGVTAMAWGECAVVAPACSSLCLGAICGSFPYVDVRTTATIRLALVEPEGDVLHDTALSFTVFPRLTMGESAHTPTVHVLGAQGGVAARLASAVDASCSCMTDPPVLNCNDVRPGDVMLIDDPALLDVKHEDIRAAVRTGACALLLDFPPGEYCIAGTKVVVSSCGMGARHVVSRDTAHPIVAGLSPCDVRYWYDGDARCIAPFLHTTFSAPGWTPILGSGNGGWVGEWEPTLAAAEFADGLGLWRLCQVRLTGRVIHNPPAAILAHRLCDISLALR